MKKKKLALGGSLSGGLSGASTGLQIGSMFGPAGSMVGATLGLIGGGILGSKQEDIAKNQRDKISIWFKPYIVERKIYDTLYRYIHLK